MTQACAAAIALLSLTALLPAQFGEFPTFPGEFPVEEEPRSADTGGLRTLTLLDASEGGRADVEALLEAAAEALPVTHAIVRGKLVLNGEPTVVGRLEALLEQAGLVPERLTGETVPLYYMRDPRSLTTILTQLRSLGSAFDEVTIAATDPEKARPALVLYGPRSQVEDCRRIISTIDIPQPEVRLDIWSFQISGGNARQVAARARAAQERMDTVAELIHGYLRQLHNCALDEQQRNAEPVYSMFIIGEPSDSDASPEGGGGGDGDGTDWMIAPPDVGDVFYRSDISPKETFKMCMGVVPAEERRVLPVPSGRGIHPLSLTETLATLALARPREGSLRETVEQDLSRHLSTWLGELDGASLDTWHRLLAHRPESEAARPEPVAALAVMADVGPEGGGGEDWRSSEAAEGLLPRRFLQALEEETYGGVAQAALSGFLLDWQENASQWRALPPERLRRRAADARVVLQSLERGLAADVSELFLDPLVAEVQEIAGKAGRSGLAAAGTTSITVLSGTQATVTGSAVSYFDRTEPPKLDAATLRRASDLTSALGDALPYADDVPPTVVVRVTLRVPQDTASSQQFADDWATEVGQMLPSVTITALPDDPPALLLVGPRQQVAAAQTVLRVAGLVESAAAERSGTAIPGGRGHPGARSVISGMMGGIPMERLASLALAMGEESSVWSVLTSGATLKVTPHVLPGGASAELQIHFTVSHDNDAESEEGAAVAPLSRVAKHEANTTIYVDSLDLFGLSSLSLRTSHPRPDMTIPVLGQMPFLGRMFRLPRKASSVHHASILLVESTILPTGMDLGTTLDFGLVRE